MHPLIITLLSYIFGFITTTDGGSLYYEVRGEGEPLLLLHGHTLDHRMWQPQVDEFAKQYRVITLDFRGYGYSSPLSEHQRISHADDVISVMDALHIDKAHVVGLSMGGFVAGDLLGMYPDRLLSCTMCSGALRSGHPSVKEPVAEMEIVLQDSAIAAVLDYGIERWRTEWIEKLVKGGGSKAENICMPLSAMINDWNAWHLTHREPHLYYGHEAMDSLKVRRPEVPTMYLSGETEHKKPMGMLKYLPNSCQVELPDCGHMSNMEQPALFNNAILDFLTKAKSVRPK